MTWVFFDNEIIYTYLQQKLEQEEQYMKYTLKRART